VPDIGVGSWPARRARIKPDDIAFMQGGLRFSYAQTAQRVESLASSLADLGVGRGDRVAYLGPNDIATFETFFAAGRLGAIFVPLNTRLSAPEIAYMLTDSGARVLVFGPELATLVAAADPARCGVTAVIALRGSAAAGQLDYDSVIAGSSGRQAPNSDVRLEDDALILYTSGTTGKPKGAVLTHQNLTFNTMNQLAHVDVLNSDVVLCTAPMFHVTGLGQVSLPTIFKGGTVMMAPKFDPGWLLATIASERITAFSAVPTMLQLLCDHPDFAGADLTSLRYVIYGGSPALERVAKAWFERGVEVLQGYGMTEAAPGVTMAVPGVAALRPTSAGVMHFFTDAAIADAAITDTSVNGAPRQAVTNPQGSGELLIRGPNVFRGYWNRPTETAESFENGWFHGGDLVRFTDDGSAYVDDRVKDMIISGGENIYPAEVEGLITELPHVADCAVVAVPDERWGEAGLAYVVTEPDADVTEADVLSHLAGRLARYKIPKYVRFIGELPRTATGKIRKDALRASAATAVQASDTTNTTLRENARP
jgi:fatty-acyl-CoA synthase